MKPVMLHSLQPSNFEVDNEKHTLKPYMTPVNHNHLNEITWLKIVHTLMGKCCQENDGRNDTVPMEDMGRDACVMIGCHERVSNLTQFTCFSRMEKLV